MGGGWGWGLVAGGWGGIQLPFFRWAKSFLFLFENEAVMLCSVQTYDIPNSMQAICYTCIGNRVTCHI